MNIEQKQVLQAIAASPNGNALKDLLQHLIEQHCDLSKLEDLADLKGAQIASAIIKDELIDNLTIREASTKETPLVNQYK